MLCAILGLTSWTGLARLLRGEALKLSQLEYIQAAHAFGVSDARILGGILPNVGHIVIIATVMDFSGFVLAESLHYGVGVDPATTSFGNMINSARLEMGREPIVWWSLAAAFGFMFVLVLAANLFADAVRDGFDPGSAWKRARGMTLVVQNRVPFSALLQARCVRWTESTSSCARASALPGESGSGKSMTALSMRLLPEAGRIASGRVALDGTDLLALPEAAMRAVRGRRVAMVFPRAFHRAQPGAHRRPAGCGSS